MRGERFKPEEIVNKLRDADVLIARGQTVVQACKRTLGLDVFKGTKVGTVKKGLLVYVLVYNLIRLVMTEAAERQQAKPQCISFIDAVRWLQPGNPVIPLPTLIMNPRRSDRIELRYRKRRPKNYPLMTKPRAT